MKVSEVMTKGPVYCRIDTSLGAAAEIMWNHNCGFLPVVSPQQSVVGVITDRDICMAMATRNRLPGQVTVQEASSVVVHSCQPDDDVRAAMETMADKKVRRLPAIDAAGKLEGVLSLDDVILHADSQARDSLSPEYILSTLRKLYESQLRQTREKAATARI
jgi:CBS domain-containing protein